ncbi:MAG: transporter, partial [Gemmatimonadota bacterium]|nr:transporter [Gemmatimonadota bacterium]
PAKTWSLSALGRYEVHGERSETKVTPGNNFLIEWGLAKNACKVWDIGLTGYMQWQLTDDSGTGVTYDKSIHDKVYAMGPELMAFIPPAKLFFSIRTLFEFGAEDRSQGNITTLTLTKIF